MQSSINIPEHKRALVSKVCLDELLWGNALEGPTLIRLSSCEIETDNLCRARLGSDCIPVLALFTGSSICGGDLDVLGFREWYTSDYPDNEKDDDLERFEELQQEFYDRAVEHCISLLKEGVTLDLTLISENWVAGIYKLEGV